MSVSTSAGSGNLYGPTDFNNTRCVATSGNGIAPADDPYVWASGNNGGALIACSCNRSPVALRLHADSCVAM